MSNFPNRMATLCDDLKENNQIRRRPSLAVYADIVDLQGDPIALGQPTPVLRRTASGHLFLPTYPVDSCGNCTPRPASLQPSALERCRWSLGSTPSSAPFAERLSVREGPAKVPVVAEGRERLNLGRTRDYAGCYCRYSLNRKGRFSTLGPRRWRSQVGIVEGGWGVDDVSQV